MKNRLTIWWHQLATPRYIDTLARQYAPWCDAIAWVLLVVGFLWGLFFAPADYQQGDAFRIIYVHVPVAVMSMAVYVSMAFAGVLYFVWHINVAAYYCRGMAVFGAVLTALALLTGAVWGKDMWGTYWSWHDPRLLSELILLFLYLGYIGLVTAIEPPSQADKMGAIVLVVGVTNIPVIHYSVVWWNSLHQGATLFKWGRPSMTHDMLIPLLICLVGLFFYTLGYALTAIRTRIVEHKNHRQRDKNLGVIND